MDFGSKNTTFIYIKSLLGDNYKMRLIIFAAVFAIIIGLTAFAQGLEITRVDVHADYDYSTVYRIEQEEKITRIDSITVPLEDNSMVNVDVYPGSNLTFTVTIENTFSLLTSSSLYPNTL